MRKTTFGLAGIFVLLWSIFGVPAMLHAAEPAQYAPGEALVVLKNRIGQVSAAALSSASGGNYVKSVAESAGAKVATTYAALSEARNEIFVLIKSETKSTEELLAELAKNPDVECASPNYRVQAFTTTPNDPDYGSLWGLEKIRVSEVWDTTTGSENVHVAVIDTGLYAGHPDLAANVETSLSRSFVNPDNSVTPVVSSNFSDRDGHGTHVAGTIAAVGNNEIGVVGVNWRAKIIALKALGNSGSGWDSWTIAALDYLVDLLRANPDMRIPAVNLSLGGWIPETPAVRQNSATWRAYKALDDTNRTVIVVAAGNEGHEVGAPAPADYYNQRGERIVTKGAYCYPASFTGLKNLLVVGSVNVSDTAPAFTNWSSGSVHLAAPGVNIRSTYSAEALTGASLYANLQGTSMSAPHVAGAVALLASAHADRTANQLKELLCNSANSAVNPVSPGTIARQNAPDRKLSIYGLLDVKAALDKAGTVTPVLPDPPEPEDPTLPEPPVEPEPPVTPNPPDPSPSLPIEIDPSDCAPDVRSEVDEINSSPVVAGTRMDFGNLKNQTAYTPTKPGEQLVESIDNVRLSTQRNAYTSGGYTTAGKTAISIYIDVKDSHYNLGKTALVPIVIQYRLSPAELTAIFGGSEAAAILNDPTGRSGVLFEKLALQKEIVRVDRRQLQMLIPTPISAQNAIDAGVLQLANDNGALVIALSFLVADSEGTPRLEGGHLIVPDGAHDGGIRDPLRLMKKTTGGSTGGSSGGGGGGGCNGGAGALIPVLTLIALAILRRKGR